MLHNVDAMNTRPHTLRALASLALAAGITAAAVAAQPPLAPDWAQVETETLDHFQTLLRFDTSDPPGREKPAADYVQDVLQQAGIPVEVFALEAERPNVVARLRGNGSRAPLLLMAHTDVVNVDPEKWTFPPFSATRDGGYVYGRGAVDDKDNLAASLMVMLLLQRLDVPLDRDVIFLAESGEEGSTRVGIEFMVREHYSAIEAEYCLAEGGSVARVGGEAKYAVVQTLEKIPRAIELIARGVAGHGSVPLRTNAIVHLAKAVATVADWRTPIRLNETTASYFRRLARISSDEDAARYLSLLELDTPAALAADDYLQEHEPRHASMLRTSISPNLFDAGYRINVIPAEATAMLDVRQLPDEDPAAFLQEVRQVIDDPAIDVRYAPRDVRPIADNGPLDSQAFEAVQAGIAEHYQVTTLPTMSTGATDMAYLRAKEMRCYGIGPATDREDAALGFGAHSDQERILEEELHRFVRFYWDVVLELAASKP